MGGKRARSASPAKSVPLIARPPRRRTQSWTADNPGAAPNTPKLNDLVGL